MADALDALPRVGAAGGVRKHAAERGWTALKRAHVVDREVRATPIAEVGLPVADAGVGSRVGRVDVGPGVGGRGVLAFDDLAAGEKKEQGCERKISSHWVWSHSRQVAEADAFVVDWKTHQGSFPTRPGEMVASSLGSPKSCLSSEIQQIPFEMGIRGVLSEGMSCGPIWIKPLPGMPLHRVLHAVRAVGLET